MKGVTFDDYESFIAFMEQDIPQAQVSRENAAADDQAIAPADQAGMTDEFAIASAATSREEIGNPVHHGTRNRLAREGISVEGKRARQMTKADYAHYDLLIGMESANIRSMTRIAGEKYSGKIRRLLDFADRRAGSDIADPWYTGDFEATWQDVLEGCQALLAELT